MVEHPGKEVNEQVQAPAVSYHILVGEQEVQAQLLP